jgi:ferredoxin
MGRTVVVDWDCCIGCEACAELCPDVFAMNEDVEKAYVLLAEGGDPQCIDDAIATCPAQCIAWKE